MALSRLAQLQIALGLDPSDVRGGARQVRSEMQGLQAEARRTATAFDDIKRGIAAGFGIGAGFGAFNLARDAVRGFVDVVGDSIKAAKDEETSVARLTASLQANVPAWNGQTAAIEETLAARMRLGFSDDEQRESLSRLVASTHDVTQALELERVAMDLAAFKRVDLATAATALIRVEGGQFRALKELIGSTKDITTAEEALAAVHAATAGAAEALAQTNTGKLAASSVKVGEAMEKLGNVALPIVATAMEIVGDAAEEAAKQLGPFLKDAGDLIDRAAALGEQAQKTGSQIPFIGDALRFVADAFHAARDPADQWLDTQKAAAAQAAENDAKFNELTASTWKKIQADREAARTATEAGISQAELTRLLLAGSESNIKYESSAGGARTAIQLLAGQAEELTETLNAIPRDIEIVVSLNSASVAAAEAQAQRIRNLGEDAASTATFGGAGVSPFESTIPIIDPAVVAFNAQQKAERERRAREAKAEAERLAREAKAAAERAAAEQAAAYRERLGAAFEAVRHSAEQYFDRLHDLNIKAIRDAHDHANALLDAQKAANLAPVTEAEATQRAIIQQRELARLQADLAAAQQETDPAQRAADVLRATQALADFQAQARIETLRTNAEVANAELDAQKKANDELAATATEAENERAAEQRAAFANDLKTLEASLSKHPETWARTQQEILKLLMGYGVDYKKAAQSLGDQFAAGLLSKTRVAEDAARALASGAGVALGVPKTPVPVTGIGGQLGEGIVLQLTIPVYVDGEKVSESVERVMASRFSRVSSGIGG